MALNANSIVLLEVSSCTSTGDYFKQNAIQHVFANPSFLQDFLDFLTHASHSHSFWTEKIESYGKTIRYVVCGCDATLIFVNRSAEYDHNAVM